MKVNQIAIIAIIAMYVAVTISTAIADINVGIGRANITPDDAPIWLAGYAARSASAIGMIHHIWAKALVFEDSPDNRAVIITVDVVGLSREIASVILKAVETKHGIPRSHIFINSSHTHSGPRIFPKVSVSDDFTQQNVQHVIRQNRQMTDNIVAAVDMAMTNRAPATLSTGRGTAGFAINRRRRKIAPVDHTVPVLRICALDGTIRAVLFNYACHCTTLTGGNLLINGDYAGFAMCELEAAFPGATAFFIQGCAADQNPDPRHTVELARKYGHELATAVQAVLAGSMQTVNGPLRAAFTETRLNFAPVTLDDFRAEVLDKNIYKYARARKMLEAYSDGNPITSIPYPVQALRFGNDLTLLFMSGEVVVDYAVQVKRDYPDENLIVAGYSNEVRCYIPTLRILKEGGYEANENMMYSQLPGPFHEEVEETVFSAIREVMDAVRRVGEIESI